MFCLPRGCSGQGPPGTRKGWPHFPKGVSIKYDDIESFQRKWLEFDVRSTSYIRTVDLGLLLYACSNNHAEAQTLRETH